MLILKYIKLAMQEHYVKRVLDLLTPIIPKVVIPSSTHLE